LVSFPTYFYPTSFPSSNTAALQLLFLFSTKRRNVVLKANSGQIQQNEKQKTMLTEIKGDEESHSFKAAEKSTHNATMLESDTTATSFNGFCFAPAPALAPALSPLFDTRNNC
jgi:hypothetical protein